MDLISSPEKKNFFEFNPFDDFWQRKDIRKAKKKRDQDNNNVHLLVDYLIPDHLVHYW